MKYGLAMEQGRRKVNEINLGREKQEDSGRVARLEEQVRRLQSTGSGSGKQGSCPTCTRPTHGKGECPGRRLECFACGQMGHFKGAAVCKGKSKGGKLKKKETAHQVQVD